MYRKSKIRCGGLIYLFSFVLMLSIAGNASAELVAYWTFDEGSGDIAYDSSGNGNNGTIHGAKWDAGKYGNALLFNAQDNYVEVPTSDSLEIATNVTIAAWIDGYDNPPNGSLVGYENPPFAELTIVHSGSQSMPLYYDNSVGYSEATYVLTYPRDWTENGVTTLTIWFRGDSDNAAETLYVALNGSAVVTHDNPNAAQIETWTQWNIDLQAFADQGVNLANVNTIALGLGNRNNPVAGGSGTMYFDDIRLYAPVP